MFKRIWHILSLIFVFTQGRVFAQSFLNGSFEVNTAGACDFNLPNATFTSRMANSTGYGVASQLDIMQNSCSYGTPQSGSWMVSLATNAGNTDAFTTMLSAPLVAGNTYSMSFYDRGDPAYPPGVPIVIGISTVAGAAGTTIFTGPVPANGPWTLRAFTFVAPNNGQHVSISTTGAPLWTFVDNFCLGCPVLPIELSEFTASCEDKAIVLRWSTSTEKNNDHFSIERSEDGKNFTQLGTVKGAGNSYIKINYSFTDDQQLRKQAYYRVKQTDFDQSITYSGLVTTELCRSKTEFELELFPQPASDILNLVVRNYDAETKLLITDTRGKTIYESNIEKEENAIDISAFERGLYFIQLTSGQKNIPGKFIKN